MVSALLISLLLASGETDRAGSGVPPWEIADARHDPRLRLNLGGLAAFQATPWVIAGGGGLWADVGVVLFDRLSLMLHAEGCTTLTRGSVAGGLGVDFALNDFLSIGLGANVNAWVPVIYSNDNSSSFFGLTFPVKVQGTFWRRSEHQVAREGFTIAFSVAPGVSLVPTYSAFTGLVSDVGDPALSIGLSFCYSRW